MTAPDALVLAPAPAATPSATVPAAARRPMGAWTMAALVLAGGCAALVLAGATAPWLWAGEVAVHWSSHATLGLLPALAACWRRPRLASALLALALVGALPALRAMREPRLAAPAASASTLGVAFVNVYDFNRERPAALAAVAALDAEVVGLAEVSAKDQPRFVGTRWPFQHWEDRDPVLSVALLSTLPIASATLHDLDEAGVLEARLALGDGRSLRVLVAHLFSPKNGTALHRRSGQLRALAALIAADPGPALLLGDLNVSPASPAWRAFIAPAGLARAPGVAPATWPAVLGPCGIGIDHLLCRGLALDGLRAFALPGSDHRGVRATAHLPLDRREGE
jgi:endonuclease/exonuclease/phosphatase (EEP) superfamily protein YafD